MKKVFTVFFLVLLAAAARGESREAGFVEGIAAVVNGEIIFESELAGRMRPHLEAAGDSGGPLPELRRRELDSLIEEKLIESEAAGRGISVGEDEVAAEIGRLKAGLGSDEMFAVFLRERNLTESMLAGSVRVRLLAGRLVEKEVARKVPPPDESEVRAFYDENAGMFVEPEKFRVSRITVEPGEPGGWMGAGTKIEEIKNRLGAGEDFGSLARKYSSAEDAAAGGDMGFLSRGSLPPELEAEIASLDIGGTTGIIRTGEGFHLMKLTGKREARRMEYEEAAGQIKRHLFHLELEEAAAEWFDGLKAEACIKVMGE